MSKGVFIEGITVEMLRNASLEAVETLLNEGDMVDMDVTPSEWIPVGERLPEIYIPVILSGKHNEVIGYRRNDSDWMALTGDGWEADIEHPEDFIAWMPLPEPYKGGDTE